jgi:thiosulfate/3-mercaptopyruvate sulfurtransferase
MDLRQFNGLITAEWLHEHLGSPDLIVLDASIAAFGEKVDSNQERFEIAGARFFDLDGDFSLLDTKLPHMMPTEAHFNAAAQKLGINQESAIVVYDNLGIYSSPRIWWMFRAMCHENIAVLDGGLPAWQEKYAVEPQEKRSDYPLGNFNGKLISSFFNSANEVLSEIENPKSVLIDARASGRFYATEPEPRAGLRGGHIPNSKNLPFPSIIADGQLLATEALQGKFDKIMQGADELIFSCGSGLTACILALGAHRAGYDNLSVYDGSWAEWGMPGDLPVFTTD